MSAKLKIWRRGQYYNATVVFKPRLAFTNKVIITPYPSIYYLTGDFGWDLLQTKKALKYRRWNIRLSRWNESSTPEWNSMESAWFNALDKLRSAGVRREIEFTFHPMALTIFLRRKSIIRISWGPRDKRARQLDDAVETVFRELSQDLIAVSQASEQPKVSIKGS